MAEVLGGVYVKIESKWQRMASRIQKAARVRLLRKDPAVAKAVPRVRQGRAVCGALEGFCSV